MTDKIYKLGLVIYIALFSFKASAKNNFTPLIECNFIKDNKLVKHKGTIKFTNYPNPVTNQTTITYVLPTKAKVILKVIDLTGKQLAVLIRQEQDEGKQEYNWQLHRNHITSGMYILVLQVGNESYTKKIIVQ